MANTAKPSEKPRRVNTAADRQLDDALEQTFPASDPVSVGDVTGAEPPKIVAEVMRTDADDASGAVSQGAAWCFEDDRLDEVVRRMARLHIDRMPVIDRDDKRIIGAVLLRDLAAMKVAGAQAALRSVSDRQ